MIVYKNTKGFETRSDKPDENWLSGADVFVVPDGSALADKILAGYPNYDFVVNEEGELADVIPLPSPPPSAGERIAALKAQLAETDYKIIKCAEYQLAGLEPPYDIAALHAQRQPLRDEINRLEEE